MPDTNTASSNITNGPNMPSSILTGPSNDTPEMPTISNGGGTMEEKEEEDRNVPTSPRNKGNATPSSK
jgi:hypothetical protein